MRDRRQFRRRGRRVGWGRGQEVKGEDEWRDSSRLTQSCVGFIHLILRRKPQICGSVAKGEDSQHMRRLGKMVRPGSRAREGARIPSTTVSVRAERDHRNQGEERSRRAWLQRAQQRNFIVYGRRHQYAIFVCSSHPAY